MKEPVERVTPAFGLSIGAGRLRVLLDNGLLLCTGEITRDTSARLRALADLVDLACPPPPEKPEAAIADLFSAEGRVLVQESDDGEDESHG